MLTCIAEIEGCRFLACFIDLPLLEPLEADEDGAATGFGGFATVSTLALLEDKPLEVDSISLFAVLVREAGPEEDRCLVGFSDATGTSGGGGSVTGREEGREVEGRGVGLKIGATVGFSVVGLA